MTEVLNDCYLKIFPLKICGVSQQCHSMISQSYNDDNILVKVLFLYTKIHDLLAELILSISS